MVTGNICKRSAVLCEMKTVSIPPKQSIAIRMKLSQIDITPKTVSILLLVLLLHFYTAVVIYRKPTNGIFLLAILGKVYSLVFVKFVYSSRKEWIWDRLRPFTEQIKKFLNVRVCDQQLSRLLPICAVICFFAWIAYGVIGNAVRMRAIGGIFVFIIISVCLSTKPRQISWRPVLGGFSLQFLFGTVFLKWERGNQGLQWLVNKVVSFLDLTFHGTDFVYGFVSTSPKICGFNYVFLFTALQIIIFFGAIVAVLYHFGIIQAVLSQISTVMRYTVGTTAVESLNAAACIFLGQTEAALLIGEALPFLTSSELHSVMTAGFACIAGSLFSAFIAFGACPTYLLCATLMSACVSLAISKIIYPETEKTKFTKDFVFSKNESSNVLECISGGAVKSSRLVLAIGANVLVFLALLACTNAALSYFGDLVGMEELTLNWLLARLFYPLAYMMGASDAEDPAVASQETMLVAELMGMKTVLNEFIAYQRLSSLILEGKLVGARARMIATFACCGFSNISMIGSTLGVLGQLVPERKRELAQIVVRALCAGAISCFVTATVAGIIIDTPISCQPHSQSDCLDLSAVQSLLSRNITFS